MTAKDWIDRARVEEHTGGQGRKKLMTLEHNKDHKIFRRGVLIRFACI